MSRGEATLYSLGRDTVALRHNPYRNLKSDVEREAEADGVHVWMPV